MRMMADINKLPTVFLVLSALGLILSVAWSATEVPVDGQSGGLPSFASYSDLKMHLAEIVEIPGNADREAAVDEFWNTLRSHDQFPFVAGDSVAFLFRGEARSITFTGDFNGWNPSPPQARRLPGIDVWLQEEVFPGDSRLDYKVVRNEGQWMLDPENHQIQRGGFGDNSELRMPDYQPSSYVDRRTTSPRGELVPGFLTSTALGYPVNYQVYKPAEYSDLSDLPVLYVTDGHEYADDGMGSLVAVLDNLIADGLIRPVMAVFIDPRVYGSNRRAEQYVLNDEFVRFVADELVPVIDESYKTSTHRADRGILGTSLGGLNSAWFALKAPETFQRIAIQSPAFQVGDGRIIDLYREAPRLDVDIFMTWGTFHDFGDATREFQSILDAKGYDYAHVVVNEGHSWGVWRALLDDVLIAFWPSR